MEGRYFWDRSIFLSVLKLPNRAKSQSFGIIVEEKNLKERLQNGSSSRKGSEMAGFARLGSRLGKREPRGRIKKLPVRRPPNNEYEI